MEKPIMISIAATVLFIIVKVLEMKFVDKETTSKPLKLLVRDALIVFVCAFIPTFAFFQMNGTMTELLGGATVAGEPTQIFTGAPEF